MPLWSRGEDSPGARPPVRAVVGAARRINLGRRSEVEKMRLRQGQPWQHRAWGHYDAIGEVKYAYNYFANILSRVRFYAAYSPDDKDGPPVPIGSVGNLDRDLVTAARYEVAKFDSAHGGQPGLTRAAGLNLAIAGEAYLVEFGDQMSIYSTNEVQVQGGATATSSGVQIKPRRYSLQNEWIDLPVDTFIARIWRPHPAWSDEADSAMLGVSDSCEELIMLSRLIRALAMSNIPNGILYVAEELTFERAADVNKVPEPDDPDNPDQGEDDAFEEELTLHLTDPINDDLSPDAVNPLLVRGPYDMADKAINKIDLDRKFDQKIVELREKALERVLNGLDIPKDLVSGLANVRFSNAQTITEDMYKSHIEPMAVLLCEAFTVTRLRPALLARGIPADKVARATVWYDASEVVTSANRSTDADAGHDRILISDAAWRRDHGYSEQDKPDDDEYARRVAAKSPVDPALAVQMLGALVPVVGEMLRHFQSPPGGGDAFGGPSGGPVIDAQAGGPPNGLPPGTGPAQPAAPAPADSSGAPPPPEGAPAPALTAAGRPVPVGNVDLKRLLDIERRLRASLQTMLSDMTERALEKAGSRLTSKVRGRADLAAKIRDVPKAQVAAVLGKEAVVAAGYTDHQIINDSVEQAGEKYKQQVKQAHLQAARVLGESVFNDNDVDASWAVLKPMLIAFMLRALFRKQEAGYSLKVPMDDVRAALARAGGASASSPAKNGRPQPGAVFSDSAIGALADRHSAEPTGYRWIYGISDNHFKPHLDLDGKEFADWSDPVLRNPNPAFPKVEHLYPGDHSGCFVAGTVASGPPVVASSIRWYEGPGVVLRTTGGKQFAATINHPILTRRGWVGAGDLVPGDQVVRSSGLDGVLVDSTPNDRQMPARIENIAAAFHVPGQMLTAPVSVSAEHFHGDGRYSEIAVIRANRDLWLRRQSALDQKIVDDTLILAVESAASLLPFGVRDLPFEQEFTTAHCVARAARALPAALDSHLLVGQSGLSGLSARRHSGSTQILVDGVAVDAELSSEGFDRYAGRVQFDQVVSVCRTDLACHVYNLQTTEGWYLADGIVAHNCECDWMPTLVPIGGHEGEIGGKTLSREEALRRQSGQAVA